MKKLKKFMSEEGVSLIQTLLGAAIIGGLALVLARVGVISSKIQRSASNSLEVNQFNNIIQKLMFNNTACARTLKSNNFVARGTNPNPTTVMANAGDVRDLAAIFDFQSPTPNSFLEVANINHSGRFIISDIEVTRQTADATTLIDMEVEFELKNDGRDSTGQAMQRQSFGGSTIRKQYQILATFDATTNEVTECYSNTGDYVDNALEQVCTTLLNGTWTAATSSCSDVSGLQSSQTFTNNAPNTTSGPFNNWSYCALIETGGEDNWKDSTDRGCTVAKVPNGWTLYNYLDDGRSNRCSMRCFRL